MLDAANWIASWAWKADCKQASQGGTGGNQGFMEMLWYSVGVYANIFVSGSNYEQNYNSGSCRKIGCLHRNGQSRTE